MKTLLAVEHHSTFGGPHNQLLRLSMPLRRRGWETVVVLPEGPGNACERLRAGGIKVIQVPLHRPRKSLDPRQHAGLIFGLIPEIRTLRRVMTQVGADVVQVIGTMYPHGAVAARLEGVPVVWQLLSTFAPLPIRCAMMPVVLSLSEVVMSTGLAVARAHPGATVLLGNRLVPFFPPVDTDEFRPDPDRRARAREKLGVPPEGLLVGTVGNFNWQKGHDILVQAAARVCGKFPQAYFRVLGAATGTQTAFYEKRVRTPAAQLGLLKDRRLEFVEPGERVAEFLPAFDLFVMTSRAEGVPTAILEAFACALPVVATDVGAVGEVVKDGRNGHLTPPRNSESTAKAILDLLQDTSLRSKMGAAGREDALARYDLRICAETHLKAFELAQAYWHSRNPQASRHAVGAGS